MLLSKRMKIGDGPARFGKYRSLMFEFFFLIFSIFLSKMVDIFGHLILPSVYQILFVSSAVAIKKKRARHSSRDLENSVSAYQVNIG